MVTEARSLGVLQSVKGHLMVSVHDYDIRFLFDTEQGLSNVILYYM